MGIINYISVKQQPRSQGFSRGHPYSMEKPWERGWVKQDTTLLVFDYIQPSPSYPEISKPLVYVTGFKTRFHV